MNHRVTEGPLTIADLDGGSRRLTGRDLADLASRVQGSLLRRGDAGWDDAVQLWNAMITKVPALVVQPASADDVATAVRFAAQRRLLLGIKGGGHNIAGTSIAAGGLQLDMSRMSTVAVDPDAKRARVGPGCRLGDVDRATHAHGLATPLGFVSTTGVAGLTLGGGFGYLTRRFGWAVDNLEELEVVTADGRVRVVDRQHDADLFWALRGGGGNFGVVTRFTFRLHEVGPRVTGGLIVWGLEHADAVLPATVTTRNWERQGEVRHVEATAEDRAGRPGRGRRAGPDRLRRRPGDRRPLGGADHHG